MEYIARFFLMVLTSLFVENIIFTRAFGTSRVLYILREPKTLLRRTALLTGVITVAGAVGYPLRGLVQSNEHSYVLVPMLYIGCIAVTYAAAYVLIKKLMPGFFENVKDDLGPAAFNCAALGSLLIPSIQRLDFVGTLGYGLGMGLGFGLAAAIIGFGVKRLELCRVPRAFKGLPILLIYLGLLSLAFYGLVGHQLPT